MSLTVHMWQAGEGQTSVQPLPWFGAVDGYALVPPPGSLLASDDPVLLGG